MADIIFHSMPDSAYLWTAMHVADEKGVTWELNPLVYRSAEHLKLHPFGKMPVMQHGAFFLYETIAIAHYLDEAFSGPALQPQGARARAEMLRWIGIVNSYVFPTMNRFMKERLVKGAFGLEPDAEFLAAAQEPLKLQMRLIDEQLTRAPFLAGNWPTLADSFLLPDLLFFAITAEGRVALSKAKGAADWLERMKTRPSYQKSPMRTAYEFMSSGPAAKMQEERVAEVVADEVC
jgi:glutathione S-transferase